MAEEEAHPQAGWRVRMGPQLAEQIKLGPSWLCCVGEMGGEAFSQHILGPNAR
jgi:hypothetical protein